MEEMIKFLEVLVKESAGKIDTKKLLNSLMTTPRIRKIKRLLKKQSS